MPTDMNEGPWYQNFFGQRYLDSYSHILTPEQTLRQVDFIERVLGLPSDGKILDLCCGHGRHLVELASRGYQMTGLDLDPLYLEMAHRAAQERNLQVRLECKDMRDIPYTDEFDAIINIFTSFGYLESDEEDQKVLNGVGRALKPGGLFLMELLCRDYLMRIFRSRDWYETPAGVRVLEERTFDALTGRNNARQISFYPDGHLSEAHSSLRVYTLTELARMLDSAGLNAEATYRDMSEEPYTFDSRLAILARKD